MEIEANWMFYIKMKKTKLLKTPTSIPNLTHQFEFELYMINIYFKRIIP